MVSNLGKIIKDKLVLNIESSTDLGYLDRLIGELRQNPDGLPQGRIEYYTLLAESRRDVLAIKRGYERAGMELFHA